MNWCHDEEDKHFSACVCVCVRVRVCVCVCVCVVSFVLVLKKVNIVAATTKLVLHVGNGRSEHV